MISPPFVPGMVQRAHHRGLTAGMFAMTSVLHEPCHKGKFEQRTYRQMRTLQLGISSWTRTIARYLYTYRLGVRLARWHVHVCRYLAYIMSHSRRGIILKMILTSKEVTTYQPGNFVAGGIRIQVIPLCVSISYHRRKTMTFLDRCFFGCLNVTISLVSLKQTNVPPIKLSACVLGFKAWLRHWQT